MNHSRAFTLIELLVVITIIVVLLAILGPSYRRAIVAAQYVECASNLNQIGVATLGYGIDNLGHLPTRQHNRKGYGVLSSAAEHLYMPVFGDTNPWLAKAWEGYVPGYKVAMDDTGDFTDLFFCPVAQDMAGPGNPWRKYDFSKSTIKNGYFIIGYDYFGSHHSDKSGASWTASIPTADRMSDRTSTVIFADRMMNSVPTWGWWKHNHSQHTQEEALDQYVLTLDGSVSLVPWSWDTFERAIKTKNNAIEGHYWPDPTP